MIFFIGIIFIIEVLIATVIIVGLIRYDRKINIINNNVLEKRHRIGLFAENMQYLVCKTVNRLKTSGECILERKRNFFFNIVKSSIIGILFMTVSKKHKKKILGLKLLMVAYDTYKNSLKV